MSILPNQSAVNRNTGFWVPNQPIQATNSVVTTGAINNGEVSSIAFKSSFTNNTSLSYLSYLNGAIQLSNIGGAGSNMSLQLLANDPNGYTVSAPAQTITGSNSANFNFLLPFVAQSPNTTLRLNVNNTGSPNTGTATVTLFTNSVISPIGQNPQSGNFFQ